MSAPPPSFDVAPAAPGHIKVRLSYSTYDPKHIRSHFLKNEASAPPPFLEEVSVLIPLEQAFHRLSAYQGVFLSLIATGILSETDTLKKFELREEDTYTLAYLEREPEPCS